ncbi:hypothetical protein DPMN_053853 [Dreissena polymorpha]|uniref:Uncharacterized protein n=1 Tax=Dreissena polymorpha TaxID=45954 RepID=A0A9D4CMX2_DREPO|nr:hypothetical protein DPMN_053853 [Dreissena polymorpha]
MSGKDPELAHEKQPLQQSEAVDEAEQLNVIDPQNAAHDHNLTGRSLIRHTDDGQSSDLMSPYRPDTSLVNDNYENPYRETTDNNQTLKLRVPSSDLVPKPYKKFSHVLILAIVGAALFVFVGVFAVRLARNAKVHHSKGLYGLAQRDSKKSVILSYLSLTLGFLLIITILVLAHVI